MTRRVRDGGGLVSTSRVASSRNSSSTYTTLNVKGAAGLSKGEAWLSKGAAWLSMGEAWLS